MLKGIPAIISPDILKVLCEIGHGDEIVIADGNFPGSSVAKAKNHVCLRADGHTVCEMLEAILTLMPLDTYEQAVFYMDKERGDNSETPAWDQIREIIKPHIDQNANPLSRFAFYDRAKEAYAVIQTTDKTMYANVIIKKGVL